MRILIPAAANAVNIFDAMPAWLRMPTPTSETLTISVAVLTPLAPLSVASLRLISSARSKSLRCTVNVKSVEPSAPTFCTIMSISSDEHTSELQSLMRISYAVLCLQKQHTQQLYTQRPRIHTT